MKIACDFVSIEHLAETQRISNELRLQRLASGAGDDVLQFHTTLWHAWKSLTQNRIFQDASDAFSIAPQMENRTLHNASDAFSIAPQMENRTFHNASDTFSISPQMESTRAMKQTFRRREKNQAVKKLRAVTERLYRPGYDFRCLLCPRMFHRAGLIDHL
jgi:hypothetical protein